MLVPAGEPTRLLTIGLFELAVIKALDGWDDDRYLSPTRTACGAACGLAGADLYGSGQKRVHIATEECVQELVPHVDLLCAGSMLLCGNSGHGFGSGT